MASQIEKGRTGVGPRLLERLADALGIQPSDLYREDLAQALPKTIKIPRVKVADLKKEGPDRATLPALPLTRQRVFRVSNVAEALKSSPATGKFRLPDWLAGRNHPNLFCVVIEEQAHRGGFVPGDIVCVDKNDVPTPSGPDEVGLYVVDIDGKLMFREGKKVGPMFMLKAHPPETEDFVLDLRLHGKNVVGSIVWWFRTFHR